MSEFTTNLEYLFRRLPGRYQTADAEQGYLLKRFMQQPCEELDRIDAIHDSLPDLVSPYTAPPEWVDFILDSFFGWDFFPEWMSAEERRFLLQDIGRLYAKRGTPEGIEELLYRFGVRARVFVKTPGIGELTLGEDQWLITEPLGIVVQLYPETAATTADLDEIGLFTIGESHVAIPSRAIKRVDVDRLLRFMKPLGQVIVVVDWRGPSS